MRCADPYPFALAEQNKNAHKRGMAGQSFPSDRTRLTGKIKQMPPPKMHPAMKQATESWQRLHGHKFAANQGRGFKKK